VVATDVGGLAEQVDGFGLVVPPLDRPALVEALVRLLRDPPLRRRLGGSGRARLEADSSPEAVVPRTLAVYELAGRAYT
jgi:glycosyltransferase involved in cell wall biosynthesis